MPIPAVIAAGLLADPPLDLTREEARRAAAVELAKPAYRAAEPSVAARVVRWLLEQAQRLLELISDAVPGGLWGLAVLALVLVAGAAAVKAGVGPWRRAAATDRSVFVGPVRTAVDHRARADAAVAAGDWPAAVVERYRALVRGLEERGLLDERPGRTADEAAAEGSVALPDASALLGPAAEVFDAVAYGGRPADAAAHDLVARAERAARESRPRTGART